MGSPPLYAQEQISAEEFLASPFAEQFQGGNYEQAFKTVELLLREYPQDPLLLRYKAMTLDLLGRSGEAIALYEQILKQNPNHVPTRFFLGQAYERAGKNDQAIQEWRWVERNSPASEYRQWAQAGLARAGVQAAAARLLPERMFLAGITGWEYDSNVTLKPDDKNLARSGDQNAGRYSLNLRVGLQAVDERDLKVDLLYTTLNSFHDDSLDDLNTTTQEGSVDLRKRTSWFGRMFILGGRYDLLGTFLEGELFLFTHRFSLSADSRLTPYTRTVLFNHLAYTNFGPDGSNTPQTSRDGLYEDIGLTQYWYSRNFRRYLFLTQEYNDARTQGGNFERRGATSRMGVHFPFLGQTVADLAAGLRWNRYPRFSSLSGLDPARRRDITWDFYAALTRPLTPKVKGRFFYRFIKADNRNDFFDYDRHIGGVQLLF